MTIIQSYAQIDSPDPINPPDLATKNYVDTRYAARAYRSAAYSTSATAGASIPLVYDVKQYDPTNCYSTSTGLYTVKVAGVYFVRMTVSIGMTAAGSVTAQINKNAAQDAIANIFQSIGASATVAQCTSLAICAVGDTIGFQFACSQASVGGRGSNETFMAVALLGT